MVALSAPPSPPPSKSNPSTSDDEKSIKSKSANSRELVSHHGNVVTSRIHTIPVSFLLRYGTLCQFRQILKWYIRSVISILLWNYGNRSRTQYDQCMPDCLSQKNSCSRFLQLVFRCVLWLSDTYYSKSVWRDKYRNLPAKNTVVQLLAMYTDPESHRQTYRQTDDTMMPISDHTV